MFSKSFFPVRLIAIVKLNKIVFPVCLLVLFACAKSQVEIYPARPSPGKPPAKTSPVESPDKTVPVPPPIKSSPWTPSGKTSFCKILPDENLIQNEIRMETLSGPSHWGTLLRRKAGSCPEKRGSCSFSLSLLGSKIPSWNLQLFTLTDHARFQFESVNLYQNRKAFGLSSL